MWLCYHISIGQIFKGYAMSSVAQHLMTAEEFWQSPATSSNHELVRGEVIKVMPPGGHHGAIAVAVAMLLRLWAQRSGGGYVAVEAGYQLAYDPDTVRGPDISYTFAPIGSRRPVFLKGFGRLRQIWLSSSCRQVKQRLKCARRFVTFLRLGHRLCGPYIRVCAKLSFTMRMDRHKPTPMMIS